ncbi:hypothetical protein AWB66_05520 [Caballeronia telluris]|uniref:Uncharacterized protein n=1 Tax=Caballeronia telluris TaxID=326475 RepID=A0A158K846_9BURK|nr:hypothetical protein AWB66_05520 [Caballeronia telluris]
MIRFRIGNVTATLVQETVDQVLRVSQVLSARDARRRSGQSLVDRARSLRSRDGPHACSACTRGCWIRGVTVAITHTYNNAFYIAGALALVMRIGKPLFVEMHAYASEFGIQSPGEQRGKGAELRRLGGSVFDEIEHGRPSDKKKNPRTAHVSRAWRLVLRRFGPRRQRVSTPHTRSRCAGTRRSVGIGTAYAMRTWFSTPNALPCTTPTCAASSK